MKNLCLLLSILFLSACTSSILHQDWAIRATMPTARSEMASTIVDGKIYVPGGIRFWGSTDKFEVYDIASNQ